MQLHVQKRIKESSNTPLVTRFTLSTCFRVCVILNLPSVFLKGNDRERAL